MTSSLNIRFQDFLSKLPKTEEIDNLDLKPKYANLKRADYLFDNRNVIIEVKSLETDPEYKVHDELKNHENRDDYPLFYGELELNKILKHLPDGEKGGGPQNLDNVLSSKSS